MEVIHYHFNGAVKMVVAQLLMLGSNACGTVIKVANTQILTSQRNHGRGAKTKAFGAQDSGFNHIQACLETAVSLQSN